MRCDANISVRKKGDPNFGTRTEVKNLNSIRNVQRAIQFEMKRQVDVLENGGVIDQHTMTFDPVTGETTLIGTMGPAYAGIAFTSNGTLYSITGEGGNNPETLHTVNINTGQTTIVQAMPGDDGGEAIAFNPDDGMLYRATGFTTPLFQKIQLSTGGITNIPFSGDMKHRPLT